VNPIPNTDKVVERVVMFVDISGSSWLYKELGDKAAVRRVRGVLSQLSRVVDELGGRTIKHIGDGLMCDFASADHALQAAEAMHMAVADEGGGTQPNLDIHIGCHLGQVVESGGDVFGDTVNIAARVAGVARTGQILTTQQTVDGLSATLRINTRPLDRVSVKGQTDTVALFDYLWKRRGELTAIGIPPAQVDRSRLKITRDGHEVWLDGKGGTSSILLGRDRGCGLAVSDPAASRHHATIEVRGDRFVLVDHSANGTYVASGTTETCLKREELILPAQGRLGLGASTSSHGVTVLEFSKQLTR
jgi:adenylate cyclase